jgi:ectoine hydroxylase-related dioxygenase (phytanoyl-CoA dioxygenase family)
VTDEEKFLFDLRGYLVIDDVLTPEQVCRANEAIDAKQNLVTDRKRGLAASSQRLQGAEGKRGFVENPLGFERPWCEPFREMLAHPRVIDVFNEILGPAFRLDHGPMLIEMRRGTEGHWMHGGQTFDPVRYHRYDHGRMRCGLSVATWQLTDVRDGDGGFACIPGSHKSYYRAPRGVVSVDDDLGCVRAIPMKAGSLLIFNEALMHGTLPWAPKNRVRRSILFKYSPGFLAWTRPAVCPIADPTPEELALFETPHRTGRTPLGGATEEWELIHAY